MKHMCTPNMHAAAWPPRCPCSVACMFLFCVFLAIVFRQVCLQWGMSGKRGHSFISRTHTRTHTPSTHTHTSLTGLSSSLSQASLVLSVSLKRKTERGREMEEGCQGRGEKEKGQHAIRVSCSLQNHLPTCPTLLHHLHLRKE